MADPLIERTKQQQRSEIRFLWSDEVKTVEMYGTMTVQYGENCMNQRKVEEWVEGFTGWRESVVHDVRYGRPSTVIRVDVTNHIDQRIRDNQRIDTDETEPKMSIKHGTKRRNYSLRLNQKYFIPMETENFIQTLKQTSCRVGRLYKTYEKYKYSVINLLKPKIKLTVTVSIIRKKKQQCSEEN
jgi:hypothetical protein